MPTAVHGPSPFDALLERARERNATVPAEYGTFAHLVSHATGVLVASQAPSDTPDDTLGLLLDLFQT